MIIYLTHNDQPSGVYWSQVTDVVEHLNTLGGERVKLVALVSLRGFRATRGKIKAHCGSAFVLPMVPTMRRWKRNTAILAAVCRALKPSGIICRGPFATWMALRMRDRRLTKRVCFDGRGAYAAEWEEYRVIDDDALIAQLRPLEAEAVLASDLRLAVSHALVDHWRERYGYTGSDHVVVPCTLGREFTGPLPLDVGADRGGMHFVYSGSAAGWQSFELLSTLVDALMERAGTSVVFMSPDDPRIAALTVKYPGRVQRMWAHGAKDVREQLARSDMGILVRADSITNRVASPTKFAEYLGCGLPVLISAHLGDLSGTVERNGLGTVYSPGDPLPDLRSPNAAERKHCHSFALQHFTKAAHDGAYRKVLQAVS